MVPTFKVPIDNNVSWLREHNCNINLMKYREFFVSLNVVPFQMAQVLEIQTQKSKALGTNPNMDFVASVNGL